MSLERHDIHTTCHDYKTKYTSYQHQKCSSHDKMSNSVNDIFNFSQPIQLNDVNLNFFLVEKRDILYETYYENTITKLPQIYIAFKTTHGWATFGFHIAILTAVICLHLLATFLFVIPRKRFKISDFQKTFDAS